MCKGKRRALPPNASSSLAGTSASASSASTSSPLAGPSSSSAAASAPASAPASASSSSSLAQAQVLSSSSGGQPGPGSGPSSTSSSFALSNENPFVPSSVVAQQIIGPSFRLYSEDGRGSGSSLDGNNNNRDGGNRNVSGGGGGGGGGGAVGINDAVGRAALMKMSEISRRAGEMLGGSEPVNGGGMFGFADGGGGGGGERPPSRLWTAAANAGLINADGSFVNGSSPGDGWSSGSGGGGGAGAAPTKITSRQEALAKIEELQRMRPASTGFLSNAAAKLVNAMETYGSGVSTKMSRQQQDGETGSLRENTPYSSLSDDSSEDVVMPSASTMAANAAEPNQQQQRAQQLPQDSRSNDTGAEQWNMTLPSVPPLSSYSSQDDPSSSSQSQSQQQPDQSISQLSMLNPFPDYTSNHEGLQVYTVGHLMPKSAIDDMSGAWNFDAGMLGGGGGGGEQGQSSLPLGEFNFSNGNMGNPFMPSSSGSQIFDPSSSSSSPESGTGPKKLRVRRSTFVPGWAVSPRVLLVDDDAVSRKLSSKFLQVFGCKIDVAVDGVGAVNKMNLEKYDLVLMDIVMPKLDGVSATSMIRKFDHMTPIISMTSNSKPNDIMHYYHSGMNDILPKPFTKQGLLDMLEKHLMHLKVIQQMSRIPRSLGIPPLSDSGFEQAITSQAALLTRQNVQQGEDRPGSSSNNYSLALAASSLSSGVSASSSSYGFSPLPVLDGDDDDFGRLNPLAGMGLTDEQYSVILTGIVNGETFAGSMDMGLYGSNDIQMDNRKRGLDEQDDNRNGKRSRFEVVE
ncbi:hypothetical protein D9757_010739 [Collybiopsis confluens]|uniref:Response regulatory domain-containing protein n=1 Tax=Collybiopsis confluens TaxID=2823264 RepID=A0A8H5H097_9AGAR|nr:hypothetical protein D9757_010739 [Collybiopsis confluens]